jgi:tetratricopeptide (TPR) repeat protein
LEGDTTGNYGGFLSIIDDYGWTKTANLSKYRAGLCYLHLGEYDNAIEYLEKFNGKEPITTAAAYSALGDAHAEKNEVDKAISYYKKAAEKVGNNDFAPRYLLKAGNYLMMQGKKEEALEFFMKVARY